MQALTATQGYEADLLTIGQELRLASHILPLTTPLLGHNELNQPAAYDGAVVRRRFLITTDSLGLAFSRRHYEAVRQCRDIFCHHDDYPSCVVWEGGGGSIGCDSRSLEQRLELCGRLLQVPRSAEHVRWAGMS